LLTEFIASYLGNYSGRLGSITKIFAQLAIASQDLLIRTWVVAYRIERRHIERRRSGEITSVQASLKSTDHAVTRPPFEQRAGDGDSWISMKPEQLREISGAAAEQQARL